MSIPNAPCTLRYPSVILHVPPPFAPHALPLNAEAADSKSASSLAGDTHHHRRPTMRSCSERASGANRMQPAGDIPAAGGAHPPAAKPYAYQPPPQAAAPPAVGAGGSGFSFGESGGFSGDGQTSGSVAQHSYTSDAMGYSAGAMDGAAAARAPAEPAALSWRDAFLGGGLPDEPPILVGALRRGRVAHSRAQLTHAHAHAPRQVAGLRARRGLPRERPHTPLPLATARRRPLSRRRPRAHATREPQSSGSIFSTSTTRRGWCCGPNAPSWRPCRPWCRTTTLPDRCSSV